MTISKDSSAPLVAVVGITGIQGGSVLKELAASDKPYRVRGFTRDATKPASKAIANQGVELVSLSIVVENKDAVSKAFAGADIAFVCPFLSRSIAQTDNPPTLARHQLLGAHEH
jgi:uncharacterized protein YbjT (DUF2867 family)